LFIVASVLFEQQKRSWWTPCGWWRSSIHYVVAGSCTPGVPNLGYMYPWGYICLCEGVHL